jgi:hypothetical protein
MGYCVNEINEWGRHYAIVSIPPELEAYSIGVAVHRGVAIWKTVFIVLKDGTIIKWWNDADSLETYCTYTTYTEMLREVYDYMKKGAEINFKNVPDTVMKDLESMRRTPKTIVARLRFYFRPEKEPKFNKSPWTCDLIYDEADGRIETIYSPRNPALFGDDIYKIIVEIFDKRLYNAVKDTIELLLKLYPQAKVEYVWST